MIYKKMLVLLVFIVMVVSVSATQNWYNYGNMFNDLSPAGDDSILFGSNMPFGNSNLTLKADVSLSLDYPPIIADLNGDTFNEIIYVEGGNAFLKVDDATLSNLDFITTTGFFSNPVIVDYESDGTLEIGICNEDDFEIYSLAGSSLELEFTMSDVCSCVYSEIFSDLEEEFVYTAFESPLCTAADPERHINLSRIGYNVNSHGSFIKNTSVFRCSDTFQNPFFVHDVDNDGNPELTFIGTTSATSHINTFEFGSNSYELEFVPTIQRINNCSIAAAQVGDYFSTKEIAFYLVGATGTSNTKLMDKNGNVLFSEIENGTSKSFISVADVDYDGENEGCYLNSTSFTCRDVLGNVLFSANHTNALPYLSLGEYNSDYTNLELITDDAMYTINGSELYKIREFGGLSGTNAMAYPVSLNDYGSYVKDLLLVSDSQMQSYYSVGEPAVCGNSICENGENYLNCFEDCFVDEVYSGYCANIEFNPDYNSVWKNGTQVQISVTGKSQDNTSRVRTRVFLYYTEEGIEWDSGWSDYIPHGTERVYDTFANHTTTGAGSLIRVYCANEANPNFYQSEGFTFNVALDGIEFNDATSSYTNPIEQQPQAGEVDTDDNAINDFMDIFGISGIGRLAMWLIIMTIVGISLVLSAQGLNWSGAIIMGVLLIIETFMLIIGVILGYIPVGVIIVMVILGIGIGALIWRRSAVGA